MTSRRLIVQTADSSRELLFIGRLTVGRATECDISLNDGKVSRRHAELDATGPVPRITDLGSRNGLLVNNRKVTSAELQPGDVIVIGDARILVDVVDETIAAPGFDGLATSGGEDRTAVLEVPVPPPAEPAAPSAPAPPAPGMVTLPPSPPSPLSPPPPPPPAPPRSPEPADDERTAVLPRPASPSQVLPVLPKADDDERTAVIPADEARRRSAQAPVPAQAPAAVPVVAPPPTFTPPPPPPAPSEMPMSPAPVAQPAAAPPAAEAPALPGPAASVPAAAAGVAAPAALAGPRFSWGGMLMLLCIGLGALATLMAAVPLLSSSSQAIDALSTRQARTLVSWLADGAGRDAAPTTADTIVQTVLSQDNVLDALVLDAGTGQIVAPVRQAGRTLASVPGAGTEWRSLRGLRVVATGDVVDALQPFARGGAPHLAWVRYEKPSTSDQSIALILALFAAMVLAFVASLLMRRHTAATLGHFTRQVELAVSGADNRVMQGTLVPGLERLPGIVAYLLEQRKAGAAPAASGPARRQSADAAPVAVDEPAWIIVTPSLSVTDTSPHAPPAGIRNWASGARGKHLLDVLEPGAQCNAVVQGLGALSNAPGADMTVPVTGRPPVSLRREDGGHVRIELPMR